MAYATDAITPPPLQPLTAPANSNIILYPNNLQRRPPYYHPRKNTPPPIP